MGNCCSSNESTTSESPMNNQSSSSAKKLEDRVELAFKAKRANVYSENMLETEEEQFEERKAFIEKAIPKSAKQSKTISKLINHFLD